MSRFSRSAHSVVNINLALIVDSYKLYYHVDHRVNSYAAHTDSIKTCIATATDVATTVAAIATTTTTTSTTTTAAAAAITIVLVLLVLLVLLVSLVLLVQLNYY